MYSITPKFVRSLYMYEALLANDKKCDELINEADVAKHIGYVATAFLKKAGILDSMRGKNGGFSVANREATLWDILVASEDRIQECESSIAVSELSQFIERTFKRTKVIDFVKGKG